MIDNTGTWGIRAGQQFEQGRYYATYENISDTSSGNKLRQQNLLGSYDAFLPIGDNNTKLFGGATLGLVKLEQDGRASSATAMSATLPGCRPVSCRS